MPKVAVIGSGPSGLAVAKALLEYGVTLEVFDQADAIGGMWGAPGRGAWSSFARTNLSHYSCSFSDFPWPQGTDVFPMRHRVIDYLKRYAEAFDLIRHIRFGTAVERVEPKGEHLWRVVTLAGDRREEREFDHVVVASGVFSRPHVPEFEGLASFRGRIFHAADCHSEEANRENLGGKRVLIVGAAFSGTEIAGQISGIAERVTVGLRNPMWFLPRWVQPWTGAPRYPADLVFYNRSPRNPLTACPRAYLRQVCGDPGEVSPELAFDDVENAPLTVVTADGFLSLVAAGRVRVRRSRAFAFDERGVLYADGTREDIDAVVMCTGFVSALPFLAPEVREALEFDPVDQLQPVLLHKQVFLPGFPGLAFVGYYRGPYFPIMELHGRWVARVASGEIALPPLAEMRGGVDMERRIRTRRPRPQFPHGDYVRLADDLAKESGVFPQGAEVADMDDYLKAAPVVAAHFRLIGPHAKPDLARRIIRSVPAPLMDGGA
jgi:dimethylaniline monooxygenase (N-oxide forming)